MLDENLPAFFLRPSNVKHQRDFLLSHHGSDPAPAYTIQHADPDSPSPAHKNCYAAALFDAYNPDVLYGEVLARPGWTQPTLSQEELRKNGGVPPPPQPILPHEFTVQLYSPDQQVRVELKEGKWGASGHWEFSMPISTFRTPSVSALDRGQSDPAGLTTTPKVNFAWRKESKLGKDLTCFMTGRSTDEVKKRSSRKDPDIAIALWRSMRELTIYEPNLQRLDMEDPKGLEVVLLLSAVVIKDLYFSGNNHIRETFNISEAPNERKLRRLSSPRQTHSIYGAPNPLGTHPVQPQQHPARTANDARRNSLPRLQTTPPAAPPIADPRTQWEVDAETAQLKAQAEAEAREDQRRRRAREKADEAEAKRLQKIADEEARINRKKAVEIDKETERLRKIYHVQPIPERPPPTNPGSSRHRPSQQGPYLQPIPQRTQMNLAPPQRLGSNGLSVQPSASTSMVMMSGANPGPSTLGVPQQQQKPQKKKSFFGLRSISDEGEGGKRLSKKASAMW